MFALRLLSRAESIVVLVLKLRDQRGIVWRGKLDLDRLDLLEQFLLQVDHFTANSMSELDRFHHVRFGNLMAETFDHDHFSLVGGDDHVEIAFIQLGNRWERQQFSFDTSDSHRSDRALEGQGTH